MNALENVLDPRNQFQLFCVNMPNFYETA